MPSKRMVSMGEVERAALGVQRGTDCQMELGRWRQRIVRSTLNAQCSTSLGLARILDVLDHVELGVPELAVLLLDLAQVDVLHDVAGLRVDEHRAARALEDLAFHGGDQ